MVKPRLTATTVDIKFGGVDATQLASALWAGSPPERSRREVRQRMTMPGCAAGQVPPRGRGRQVVSRLEKK